MHLLPHASTTAPTGTVTTYDPTSDTNAAGTASATGGTLSQSDFLNLLSTQLQYQDPTNPESNTDFAAQMAQFSSLSEMNTLTSTMTNFAGISQLSSGSSLIGQSVTTNGYRHQRQPGRRHRHRRDSSTTASCTSPSTAWKCRTPTVTSVSAGDCVYDRNFHRHDFYRSHHA